MESGLYLVGTPIGNLEDMTFRGVRTLREVDTILAEDTRKTGSLLKHFSVDTPMVSCHKFNERSRVDRVVEDIRAGGSVALVSDAGMPLVSDPGSRLVTALREEGLPITAVPGPTAVTTAIALSGWGDEGFVFGGFLPNKGAARRRVLAGTAADPRPAAFYESTHRIRKCLRDLMELYADRPVFVARELTKKFETLVAGTPKELDAFFETHSVKGEFVIVLGPANR